MSERGRRYLVLERAERSSAKSDSPNIKEIAEREREAPHRLHVDDPRLVVGVQARLDAMPLVKADVRGDRDVKALVVDAEKGVDVELVLRRPWKPKPLDPPRQALVLRRPRRWGRADARTRGQDYLRRRSAAAAANKRRRSR